MEKLFWNNICLLSRFEEQFIENKNLEIETNYFGLGRETDLQSIIKVSEKNWSVIVSTDTELFHDPMLLKKMESTLKVPNINLDYDNENINQHYYFKPFIIIPLVIVINTSITNLRPTSLKELCTKEYKGMVTYGGPHNSAGKSIIKAIWSLYGKDELLNFLDNSTSASMPAAAFKSVADGKIPIGIVPTIFAKRQGLFSIESVIPTEGAIGIPSFIAVNKNCTNFIESKINNSILENLDFHNLLYNRGKIISPLVKESQIPVYYPPKKFFDELDYDEYQKVILNQ